MPSMIIQNQVTTTSDKLYVGGDFISYKGVTNNGIILLDNSGTKNTTFDNTTGFAGGAVFTSVIDANGKIYVAGNFTTYKGVTENRIIRLNPDGSKDTGFDTSTGFNSNVNTIVIDANGKIYVGGNFTTYKGVTETKIIRLNPDGSKDTGFDNTTGFTGSPAYVAEIAIDVNGKIYVAGNFTSYKGVTANHIIRLNPDGSKDTGFDNTTGFNPEVAALTIDANGKIYVGGFFTSYKTESAFGIIRLNPDGSKDTGFDNADAFTGGISPGVQAIKMDANGKIYVGGNAFTTYKGVSNNNRIIRLNPDGSKDTGFDNSTGFNNRIDCITIDANGKIYVGGNFTTYKGVTENRIIRLNPDGSKDTGFDNTTGFANVAVYTFSLLSNPAIAQSPIIISPTGTNRIVVE